MKRSPLRMPAHPTLTVKVDRPKKCRAPGCSEKFLPWRPMQMVCSSACALLFGAQARLKADRTAKQAEKRVDRAAREAMKTHGDWQREAQAVFNKYIRLRDAAEPCISCGRHHQGSYDAGHYLTTGARPELRFDEANVHKQCVPCNRHLHGNLVLYRVGLVAKIGVAEVERLEGPATAKKLTIPDLRALRDRYRAEVRRLEKLQREAP